MSLQLYFPGNHRKTVRNSKPSPETRILAGRIEYVEIEVSNSRHGQLRTLDQRSVDQWREWGQANEISVLLHNYPGYGKTPGPVTVEQILEDLFFLVQFLQEKWSIEQISLLGNSIGCGPTIYLAANGKYQFNKIVLVSPYKSCSMIYGSRVRSFANLFSFDAFDSTREIQKLQKSKVFMVCGEKDNTIPPSNSKDLFGLLGGAQNYLCEIPGVGHKYTRLAANDAIASFLNDYDQSLQAEIERLKKEGC